jgi:hypothetical protein
MRNGIFDNFKSLQLTNRNMALNKNSRRIEGICYDYFTNTMYDTISLNSTWKYPTSFSFFFNLSENIFSSVTTHKNHKYPRSYVFIVLSSTRPSFLLLRKFIRTRKPHKYCQQLENSADYYLNVQLFFSPQKHSHPLM